MKKIISLVIIALSCMWACSPDNPGMDFEPIPDDGRIKVVDMADDNSFMFVNGLLGNVLPPKWDLGNGQSAVGDTVYAGYAFAGTYTVKMTYYDGAREVTVSRDIKITQDNMALVSDPVYDFLTGGLAALNGKTWMLDSLTTGHVRLIRRQGGLSDDRKAPHFYDNTGMYDDRITFKLLGAECTYENHGQSYSHGGTIDGVPNFRINQLKEMGTVTGFASSPKGDFVVNYTPGAQPQKWSIVQKPDESGKESYFLKLTGGAYMFFYRGDSPSNIEYKIDSIAEDYLRVIHYERFPASRGSLKWEDHYILRPEGTELKEEVPAEIPDPKVETINEDFEEVSKSLTFVLSGLDSNPWSLPAYSVVRNISMTNPNPSDSIVRIVRGKGHDELLTLTRNYTFDLSEYNNLTMDVYLPKTNNYDGVNLKPTVEVRLVNSKNTSQTAVVTNTVTSANFGKWIKLEFNFSGSSAITTFDTWAIQFGGQYPKGTYASPGIFYFDNLKLTN